MANIVEHMGMQDRKEHLGHLRHTHTHTMRTRQHPRNDEALGADVNTPRQAMENNAMRPGAFLRGTATEV